MSLQSYRRPRMVVQNPGTPIREAARAMLSNRIGTVVVQDHGRIVGILTDRDLAVRVIAAGLDPSQVLLRDVMTPDPCTLPIQATEEQALDLMRLHRARRIPLLDGGKIVGLVTIDDLILSADVGFESISEVVRAQLAEAAEHKPPGVTHPTKPAHPDQGPRSATGARRTARMLQTSHEAAHKVRDATGLEDIESALTALEVVVEGIVRRLTAAEAHDLLSQLPTELHRRLHGVPSGPDRSLTRETIEEDLIRRLDIAAEEAHELLDGVGTALEDLVSPGEIAHVRAQLPEDLKSIFSGEVLHRTP
jgi:uncharacterized protein (DUF2267 family)/CBS domain containing-hemolysin-like protein